MRIVRQDWKHPNHPGVLTSRSISGSASEYRDLVKKNATMDVSRLVQFYLGEVPDSSGRMVHDILNFTLEEQESIHDYIQWLFPLREQSQFNRRAPLLSEDDIKVFRESDVLKKRVLGALRKMLDFYGFELQGKRVTRSAAWDERKQWVTPYNHNYLRISRILTSLRLLGLDEYAQSFYSALENVYKEDANRIGPETWSFWTKAARHLRLS